MIRKMGTGFAIRSCSNKRIMFTGIVTDVGEITSLKPVAQGQLHRMRIACRYDQKTIADGASIACNGVCLTVVASGVEGEQDLVRCRCRRRNAVDDHGEALGDRDQGSISSAR